MSERALVYGVAVAGLATVRALVDRNIDVVAVDDQPTPAKSTALANMGLDLLSTPNDTELAALVVSDGYVQFTMIVLLGIGALAGAIGSGIAASRFLDV